MKPDILVVRHSASGAAELLSQKVGCAVVNAGDGRHEHPTQALLDLLSMRRAFGDVTSLTVAICGDITHSRVARSNVALLQMMGARVRLVGPPTLVPGDADRWGCEVFHDMREGLEGCDVVMMLRLQLERMAGALVPSTREYFRFWGLDREKLAWAKPGAKVMHPGPMNRGVEIDSDVADDLDVSLIQDQVEMGVAARMAGLCLAPGLIDIRVKTGEPGSEPKETLKSASLAAAAGGVTTIVVQPDTDPAVDDPAMIDFIQRRGAALGLVNVRAAGAATKSLGGERMAEIGLMDEAGALYFTDGDRVIANSRTLQRVMSYAGAFNALIACRPNDPWLSEGAVAASGELATRLGLSGSPAIAERIGLERDLALVEQTGARFL
ncbi:hypothetical protein LTR94_026767, partial [Friedmanniomyces endolithicus]